jgi:hypothetical protein
VNARQGASAAGDGVSSRKNRQGAMLGDAEAVTKWGHGMHGCVRCREGGKGQVPGGAVAAPHRASPGGVHHSAVGARRKYTQHGKNWGAAEDAAATSDAVTGRSNKRNTAGCIQC